MLEILGVLKFILSYLVAGSGRPTQSEASCARQCTASIEVFEAVSGRRPAVGVLPVVVPLVPRRLTSAPISP